MSSREHLKQYCLRALGAPVVEINITPDQLEDRIDEALSYFNLYHYEGAEKVYLQHKITCSQLKITTGNSADFPLEIDIVGTTSGAKAKAQPSTDPNVLNIRNVVGDFLAGETITDAAGHTATLSSTLFYTPGDTENHWIPIPDAVFGVTRVVPFFQPTSSSAYIFDVQYQLMLNDIRNLTSTDLTYYTMAMSHLDLLNWTLNANPDFEFNRMMGQLRLDVNWRGKLATGQIVVVEGYRAIDPQQFSKVWIEPWLRQYTTALFKRQWGINVKKFSGMILPGGIKIDGNTIFQEAMLDIKALETDLLTKSAPLGFFMG
jgi:hypothetical protein